MLSFHHLMHEWRVNPTCFYTVPFIFNADLLKVQEWVFADADLLPGEMLAVVWCRLVRSHIAEPPVASWESGTAGIGEVGLCAVCTKGLYRWILGVNWRSVILCGLQSCSFESVCLFWWIMHLPPGPGSFWKCVIAIIAFVQQRTTNFPGCSFSAHAVRCSKHNISQSAVGHPELIVRGDWWLWYKGGLYSMELLDLNGGEVTLDSFPKTNLLKEGNPFDCFPIKQASMYKHLGNIQK